jgi:hypothetical protein
LHAHCLSDDADADASVRVIVPLPIPHVLLLCTKCAALVPKAGRMSLKGRG